MLFTLKMSVSDLQSLFLQMLILSKVKPPEYVRTMICGGREETVVKPKQKRKFTPLEVV